MTNKEKLEVLKGFLKENNIPFKEKVMQRGQKFDLYISKFGICVRLSDENDQRFYEKIKYIVHPLFIRENETPEFVVEKMQNLIIYRMKCQHKRHQNEKGIANKGE